MRTSLFHRTQPRRLRRAGPLPRLRPGAPRRAPAKPAPAHAGDRPSAMGGGDGGLDAQRGVADAIVGLARSAGGPVDLATYTCSCGMLFSAPVSTTVACPRCGSPQAW